MIIFKIDEYKDVRSGLECDVRNVVYRSMFVDYCVLRLKAYQIKRFHACHICNDDNANMNCWDA